MNLRHLAKRSKFMPSLLGQSNLWWQFVTGEKLHNVTKNLVNIDSL